ncbi:MAG: patatin family protein [Treponema sp.]|jgi:predicted patatin/cPLA2 family phospholipase|nr:patatin family protein [Treponema sp.]
MIKLEYALILEGGGLRGNYTAGVLDAFLEKGLEFPFIIGVSAGAGMGCSFVSKQKERNLSILKNYRNDPRYLSVRSFIKTGNYFGLDFIYNDIPNGLVPFDMKTFMDSPSRFVTVCTDCKTGKAVYFEKGPDILTIMKASSAMPFVSRPVEYRGCTYLDGGISDSIPLGKAISEGYTKNIVVLTHPEGYRRRKELQFPAWLIYRKYPPLIKTMQNFVVQYNRSLCFAEEEAAAGRILLIRPSIDLGASRTEKNMDKLLRLYELGLTDGEAAAAKLTELSG